MKSRKLIELVNVPLSQASLGDRLISSVTSDSRRAVKGSLFFAMPGTQLDGRNYCEHAIALGAVAIISDKVIGGFEEITVISSNVREAYSEAASKLYGNPSAKLRVVGITGTSGKTTTSFLLEAILKHSGMSCGVIGTINARWDNEVVELSHTTPDAEELQRLLFRMVESGVQYVIMEVSSHALSQYRVSGIDFDVALFLNLTPEHLDYHAEMDEYFLAKSLLFDRHLLGSSKKDVSAVVNIDDSYGGKLLNELRSYKKINRVSFGLSKKADFFASDIISALEGTSFRVDDVLVETKLIGDFNSSNALAAFAAAQVLGIDTIEIKNGISSISGVPGRLERVLSKKELFVFVDYAHKPDALEKVLISLSEIYRSDSKGSIVTVVGCGGDRDKKKRPVMGAIAAKYSDLTIVTSDNPRTEDPNQIIEEVVSGVPKSANYLVIPDRKDAIEKAIDIAMPGDLVLVAGKGHETYQIIVDPLSESRVKKVYFDDRDVVRNA